MLGTVTGILALLGLLAWFFWPGTDASDAAEREVQEAPDEHSVRDWGPGASKPPLG